MGETLYRTQPVFRAVVDHYNEQLWQDREGSLLDAMFHDETLLAANDLEAAGTVCLAGGTDQTVAKLGRGT